VYLLCATFGLWLLKKSFREKAETEDGV